MLVLEDHRLRDAVVNAFPVAVLLRRVYGPIRPRLTMIGRHFRHNLSVEHVVKRRGRRRVRRATLRPDDDPRRRLRELWDSNLTALGHLLGGEHWPRSIGRRKYSSRASLLSARLQARSESAFEGAFGRGIIAVERPDVAQRIRAARRAARRRGRNGLSADDVCAAFAGGGVVNHGRAAATRVKSASAARNGGNEKQCEPRRRGAHDLGWCTIEVTVR